jgi:hypothetical protein
MKSDTFKSDIGDRYFNEWADDRRTDRGFESHWRFDFKRAGRGEIN